MSEYKPTIGIEIHIQLATKSKMFCGCDNDSVNAKPNTNICPICLAYPGTLPLPNKQAVQLAIRLGYGVNAQIREHTKFDRKNYFYPDNPKGYQISQFDEPIVEEGCVEIFVDGEFRKVRVERAHLEEDAGKLTHPAGKDYSLVDLNRAGTPLLEIVSYPDIHSPYEARRYLEEVYAIATTLGVTHGDMQHGNMKFDLNISVSKDETLGTRTELKNLNSFRNAERALSYEIARQIEVLEKGGVIEQETRGFDDAKGKTFTQRSKEEAHDYRYFPEPDIPPIVVTSTMQSPEKKYVESVALPIAIRRELVELGLSVDEQDVLIKQRNTAQFFAETRSLVGEKGERKLVNWLVGEYQAWIKQQAHTDDTDSFAISTTPVPFSPQQIADLISLEQAGELSSSQAKQVFAELCRSDESCAQIMQRIGIEQISDEGALTEIVNRIVNANPQAVADYRAGQAKALGFFVGQVMKETKGQANPQMVNDLIKKALV
jgi:aspartyl-tRNA(Asn)/glutamyl-tRNA(Gln) amidotransferase subunit B